MRTTIRRAAAAVAAALALGTGSAVVGGLVRVGRAQPPPSALIPVCTAGNLAVWVNADAG